MNRSLSGKSAGVLEILTQEFRYALRSLRRSPGFTATTTLSLALGIAASTLVFGVIYGINFQSLPYNSPNRLVQLAEYMGRECAPACVDDVSPETIEYWKDRAHSFSGIADASPAMLEVGDESQPPVVGARVGPEFFPLLGARTALGRTLLPSDFTAPAEPAAVVGTRLWIERLASDPHVVGRILKVNGAAYTIVGVMPRDFAFPTRTDIWIPQPSLTNPTVSTLTQREVIARLRPGVSLSMAATELRDLSTLRQREDPHASSGRIGTALTLRATAQDVGSSFWMVLGVVAAALLIACANVAGLFVVRTVARLREVALRAALGADRWRIISQSLIEGLLVASVGGVGGILLAVWGRDVSSVVIARFYNYPLALNLSPTVIVAAIAVALGIAIALGFIQLRAVSSIDLQLALRQGAATTTASQSAKRFREGLVVVEVGAALILVAGASLLTASFLRIQRFNLGYDAKHVFVAEWSLPKGGPADLRSIQTSSQGILDRLTVVPSIQSATVWGESYPRAVRPAVSPSAPFEAAMALEDRQTGLTMAAVPPFEYDVSPDFFGAMGIRVAQGRAFNASDEINTLPVAVINEQAAKLWWPGEIALGKRFKRQSGSFLTVVGVIGNTHVIGSAGVFGGLMNPGYFPLMFRPLAQAIPRRGYWVGVRPKADPVGLGRQVNAAIHDINPDTRPSNLTSLQELATGFAPFGPIELDASLLTGFAIFGALLALMGIYGLVADLVQRKTKEIGIRVALGASRSDILAIVLGNSVRLALLGVVGGLGGSLAITRILGGLLYGVSPTDPVVLAIGSFAFMVAIVTAAYVSARKALKVDPLVALRAE